MTKITINEVWKKHLRIISFLVISAVLGYVLTLITNKPEAIYFTPVINYILYAIKNEIDKEGFIKALK